MVLQSKCRVYFPISGKLRCIPRKHFPVEQSISANVILILITALNYISVQVMLYYFSMQPSSPFNAAHFVPFFTPRAVVLTPPRSDYPSTEDSDEHIASSIYRNHK